MTMEQVLERRKAEEAAMRACLREPDTTPAEQLAGKSGMQLFEGIF